MNPQQPINRQGAKTGKAKALSDDFYKRLLAKARVFFVL